MKFVKRVMVFVGWVTAHFMIGGLTRPTVAFFLLCAGFAQAAPITIKDDAGHTLTLAGPAKRVVSLAPSLTEMLFEAGGGGTLIGAVEYSDYPHEALKVPRIGSNRTLDLERIARLKPDLALVWLHGNAQREAKRLAALKIPMFYVEPHGIPEIADALARIGRLVGTEKTANEAARCFRERYEALRARHAGKPPVRVFYQVAERPLLTVNRQQIISDVIGLCGGINVFGREKLLVPELSTESVVAARPEAILTARLGEDGEDATRAMNEPSLRTWLAFKDLPAVKHGQLWLIPGSQISRHGPRILDGAEAVCMALDEARKAK